jgi:alkanesulfonate monooxygenase SsuD/methylene tetrahydromethanopterin reductase-like flavin-dependent oxidoreductase (luciferase family)
MWHGWGAPDQIAKKLTVLRTHCENVGRDPTEIAAVSGKRVVIRADVAEGRTVMERIARTHGMTSPPDAFIGSLDGVLELVASYSAVGVNEFIVPFSAPFDTTTIERLGTEVLPRLKERAVETPQPVTR